MKKTLALLGFTLSISTLAHAAPRTCVDVFPTSKQLKLMTTLDLNQRESSLILELSGPGTGVQLQSLVKRHKELVDYAYSDLKSEGTSGRLPEGRMMTAAPASLITLAAASILRGKSFAETVAVIEKMGATATAWSRPMGERRYELWLSSRLLLKLSEISIRTRIAPNVIGAKFNSFSRQVIDSDVAGDLTNPLLKPPMDQAVDLVEAWAATKQI